MKKFGGNFKSILCAMRQNNDSLQVADLAIKNYSIGVVGFDLAGPEFGHPPSKHIEACQKINDSNIGLTIHAGEAAEFSYIEDAVLNCKAKRIGHGWQIIEGCNDNGDTFSPNTETSEYIHENQIPLEICISSNVKSGASNVSLDNHPAVKLLRSGFNVTLNPDNRLMASTTLSREYEIAKQFMSLTEDEESKLLDNAKNSTFA
jgi:adenosine deaminase